MDLKDDKPHSSKSQMETIETRTVSTIMIHNVNENFF